MATLTIRNLSERTKRGLRARAARNDRSMEAEVREILDRAVAPPPDFISGWLHDTELLRGEFRVPERSLPRPFDLGQE
ncbi:MAG: plasmid stabilization protein [Propionibacteriaceae bacterium]|nr:plasmid stabilization protein [Propionibacteriaceae bacterium]